MIITIDGCSGVGKSAVAHEIANAIEGIHISMGLYFRAYTWCRINQKNYQSPCLKYLPGKNAEYPKIYWGELDITGELYGNPQLDNLVTETGGDPVIQGYAYQQVDRLKKDNLVIEGRNTYEYATGEDVWNFYLIASDEERRKRNGSFLEELGKRSHFFTEADRERNRKDLLRKTGTLKIHLNSCLLNTSGNSLSQTLQQMLEFMSSKYKSIFWVVKGTLKNEVRQRSKQYQMYYEKRDFFVIDIDFLIEQGRNLPKGSLLFFLNNNDVPSCEEIRNHLFIHEHNAGCLVEGRKAWSVSAYLYYRCNPEYYRRIDLRWQKIFKEIISGENFPLLQLPEEDAVTSDKLYAIAFRECMDEENGFKMGKGERDET